MKIIQKILEKLLPIKQIPLWARYGSVYKGNMHQPRQMFSFDPQERFSHIQFEERSIK